MQLVESLKVCGEQTFQVRDRYGNIKPLWQENIIGKFLRTKLKEMRIPFLTGNWSDKMVVKNLITLAGYAGIASRINGADGEAAFTYLELGIGNTAATTADTALDSAITTVGLERKAATCTRETTTETDDTAQLYATWTASGTKALVEAGAFNADTAGTMLGRQVFSVITLDAGDSFAMTYKFKVSV